MELKQVAITLVAAALVSGSASSHVLKGTVRARISPDQVTIYRQPPAKYETIAMLEAPDLGANRFSVQNRARKSVQSLKVEAASLGANGILLEEVETRDQAMGIAVNGMGYVSSQTNKMPRATAIYVPVVMPVDPLDRTGERLNADVNARRTDRG